jgi:D-threonate/D-erythronate kinase
MRIRIITDDFTSALDGTACFAQAGFTTAVFFEASEMHAADVVSIDTGARESHVAREAGVAAIAANAWRDADILVQQVDSTLRGHVAQDCLLTLGASQRRKLLIAPAFPFAGRTTEDGVVLVDGVPVHQTTFQNDPTHPVRQSSVPALFAEHDVRVGVARNAAEARSMLDSHDAVVVDARTEADLDVLVLAFAAERHVLWAGSTGLLRAMARVLAPPTKDRMPASRESHAVSKKPWLVVGSLNPRSRQQLDFACSRRNVNVLTTSATRTSPKAVLRDIAVQAVNLLRTGVCDGLVVTGGETARQIVDALPAISLSVCREVMPGIPLAMVRTATGEFPMITKAGGFGDDQALLACLDALSGAEQ